MSFKSLCVKYFGSDNFYEILGINPDASEKQIKKAYHRLSLLVHPDRVDEDQKIITTEKFKALGKIHSILQDSHKRKLYDEVGEFDDETDSTFNWFDYWRNLFRKIDIKDIEKHEHEYIGSETEIRDIKKAYVGTKGNMNKMLELIPFSNCDNEPRYIEIVQQMVDDGEVERYESFFNESKQKKLRRKRKWDKEKKEVEQINLEELEKEVDENMKKRIQGFANFISDLETKYASKKKAKLSITAGAKRTRSKNPRSK